MVVVEDVIREAADLRQVAIALHQVCLDVELEALLRALLLVETTEYENVLLIDRHAHGEIAGGPRRLGIQVDHAPHVIVYIVHFDRVCDLFFVELGSSREHVDVFIIEDTRGCGVPGHVQICDTAPSVILDIVFLTGSVEALCVVTSYDKDEPSL